MSVIRERQGELFTGLIEATGKIIKCDKRGNHLLLTAETTPLPTQELAVGESIAFDGACLTVESIGKNCVTVQVSQESLAKTTLGKYRPGRLVNLERALKVGDRLGGHFVTGHIDGVGRVHGRAEIGQSVRLTITFDARFDGLVVVKGSIAINGVSMTVNSLESGQLSVNVIPHTLTITNLAQLKSGGEVNLEFDLIGKYILRSQSRRGHEGITRELLAENGW